MNHSKKYIVVPFVKTIEKPNDTMVNSFDKNMSDIISDSQLSDDNKLKLYHQNLNKFLLKYDPESYGVTPVLANLARVVMDFIQKNENIDQDLSTSLTFKDVNDESMKPKLDENSFSNGKEHEENSLNQNIFIKNENKPTNTNKINSPLNNNEKFYSPEHLKTSINKSVKSPKAKTSPEKKTKISAAAQKRIEQKTSPSVTRNKSAKKKLNLNDDQPNTSHAGSGWSTKKFF